MAIEDGNWLDWLNSNAAAIQAVGSVVAILIAVGVAWLSHWLDIRRSQRAVRLEKVQALEAVASIVINAMNLIETAKEQVCDCGGESLLNYCTEIHDPGAFELAAEALREIPIAQLPDFEVVKPVIEMRALIQKLPPMIENIRRWHPDKGPWLEESQLLEKLHRRANIHTVTIEESVRRVPDGD